MSLTGHGRIAGVVGWPIAHSLSPRMHNYWLRKHRLDAAYVPLPVHSHNFSTALLGLAKAAFVGVNVTIPHKEAAFALADESDEASARSGAANLLLFQQNRIEARNTDIEGLATSCRAALGRSALKGGAVTILGAGGAARAAVLACDCLKPAEIVVLNRSRARAETLVRNLSGAVSARLASERWEEWETRARTTGLLINATSGGMSGAPPLVLPLEFLPRDATVCDLVYHPLETPLLAQTRALGLGAIDGLGMLMHQGALSFELLYGISPRVSVALRRHLEAGLGE